MQVRYEVYNNPDSCLSQLILSWYNSLYSELSTIDTFDCCAELDCTDFCVANIALILRLVPLIANQTLYLNFFVSELLMPDRRIPLQFLREFNAEVRRSI